MRKILSIAVLLLCSVIAFAQQPDRHEVRRGNREYTHQNFREAEIYYRKGLIKDSTSFGSNYNLSSALYMQKDYDGALKSMDRVKEVADGTEKAADYWFNRGNADLQKQDYASAVQDFKRSLLKNPDDEDAKESYEYAKLMLQNQQNGGGGQNDQNQDQQNQQDQQNNDQQQEPQQDEQNQQQSMQDRQEMSRENAEQLLDAAMQDEKEVQERVQQMMQVQSKGKLDKDW